MIHIVIGTRAQLIKMVPVMTALRDSETAYNLVLTGQHHATMNEILDEFTLKPPDVLLHEGLDIVSPFQMLAWTLKILARCPSARKSIFGNDRRGIVLVHGDTVSTLLGAVMGQVAGLHIGHIESGLRSFDLLHPFPEELTRLLALRLSDTLFCPGKWAVENVVGLRKAVVNTGSNTMADTAALALRLSSRRDHLPDGPFVLVSLHRTENIFQRRRLVRIVEFLEGIADRRLLFILHPPTETRLRHYGLLERLAGSGIELRPRYSYLDFFALLKAADFVVSDGGSIQEESSYLGVPCLLMRKKSERPEGIGRNVVLSGYDASTIRAFVDNFDRYRQPPCPGGESPTEAIVTRLREYA